MSIGNDHWLETYKSLVALATEGFKFSTLINGGAAVALLAYLGNVAGSNEPVPDMRYAMFFFLFGLFLCGLSIMFAYFTQLKRLNDISQNKNPIPNRWLTLAIITFELNIVSFIVGSFLAVNSFN